MSIVTLVVIGRVYQLNVALVEETNAQQGSLFVGIYAYIPALYLLAFMLLQRSRALQLSLLIWACLSAIVLALNGKQLTQEVWREGLDNVLMVVVFCQPLFIALIYRVPPYAAAVMLAQQETVKIREALGSMRHLASIDTLTNLYNRRFLRSFWDDFQEAGQDGPTYLSMFILDIDHFKEFNDAAGHLAGDRCLKKIARAIGSVCAEHNGHAVRYGGEEFLMLIPAASPRDTTEMAEAFRKAIAALQMLHPSKKINHVTVSIGATTGSNLDEASEATWIRAADSALYEAKRSGRNCTRVHGLAI